MAKDRTGLWIWRAAGLLATIILAVGGSLLASRERVTKAEVSVEHAIEKVDSVIEDVDDIDAKVDNSREAIVGMSKDIEYIKTAQKESKDERKEIRKEVKDGFTEIKALLKNGRHP